MKRQLPTLAGATLLAVLAMGAGSARASIGISPAHGFAPRQVVVKFEGERVGRGVTLAPGANVPAATVALQRNPNVEYAEPNYVATASALDPEPTPVLPNDPGTLEGPAEASELAGDWSFKQWDFLPWEGESTSRLPVSPGGIDAVGAWQHLDEAGRPGAEGVTVAVLDTGIAYRNLGERFLRSPDFNPGQFVKGYDFVGKDSLPLDENGHGTHVAGTIAEKTNNGIGLTGLAYRAKLMPVRVLGRHGRGETAIAKGIRFAVAHHAQVINMSLNFDCGERVPIVDEALREAYAQVWSPSPLPATCGSRELHLRAGDRPAGDRRRRHHRGRLPRQLLADRQGSRPACPGWREPVSGCASVLARPIYQVTLKRHTTMIRDPRQLRRHLDGRRPRQRRRRDGHRRRHLRRSALLPGNGSRRERPASTRSPGSCAAPPAAWACRRPSRAPG